MDESVNWDTNADKWEKCETCGGEGWVFEDDFECDWVNYGHDVINCPDCVGEDE